MKNAEAWGGRLAFLSLRTTRRAVIATTILLLAGCAVVSQQVHDKFDRSPARSRVFEAARRDIYDAALQAMKRIEFAVTRTSLGDGVIVGHSRIQPGDPTRSARQLELTVRLSEIDDTHTDVGLLLTEQQEDGVLGGAQGRPLRAHSLYETFLAAIDTALKEMPGAPRNGGP